MTAKCGTTGGHRRHKKLGERPCEACREAERAYRRGPAYRRSEARRDVRRRHAILAPHRDAVAAMVAAVSAYLDRQVGGPLSVVYFMEREGFIKIGWTRFLDERVSAVSRGAAMPEGMTVGPVHLLGSMVGDRADEKRLHERFAEWRLDGTEWFYPAPELLEFIGQECAEVSR